MADLTPIFAEASQLLAELINDVTHAGTRIKTSDTQPERSDDIRTAFAVIEGLTYALKKHALLFAIHRGVSFDPDERSLLVEEVYDLNDDGTIRRRRKYVRTSANLLFTVRCFIKATGIDYVVNLHSAGWSAFRIAAATRNRIHPKVFGDLHISDTEFETAQCAAMWALQMLQTLFDLTVAKHSNRREPRK